MFKEILSKVFGGPSRLYHGWLVRLSLNILKNLDQNMIKARWPRHKRRQFWRDYINSRGHRKAVELSLRKNK